jgi:DNA-directed RNA polymerase specialized sigma24 family protein
MATFLLSIVAPGAKKRKIGATKMTPLVDNSVYETYQRRFPQHAYATDDVSRGLRMYPAELALQKAIVQHNYKHSLAWLVYDLDRGDSAELLNDHRIPAPNIAVFNQDNGHGHFFYGLEEPVHNYEGASEKALRYLGAIDVAMTHLLGADPGYSKLLSKNPTHDRWITLYHRYGLYDLDELADYLDLKRYQDRRRRLPDVGYGRNCTLFEKLRRWAYRERRQPYLSEEMFLEAVRNHALVLNQDFSPPLPHAEVRATAKSVARWTWRNMSPESFIERQRKLGQKGTIKAAEKRSAEAQSRRQAIIETAQQCPALTQEDIAAMFGVRRETVNRHLRAGRMCLSDKG